MRVRVIIPSPSDKGGQKRETAVTLLQEEVGDNKGLCKGNKQVLT